MTALVATSGLALGLEYALGNTIDVHYAVLIRGRLIDATTGSPIAGGWVVPYRSHGPDAEASVRARARAVLLGDPSRATERGLSDQEGVFEFRFDILWPKRVGLLGSDWGVRDRPPPFHEVCALGIGAPSRRYLKLDTCRGAWIVVDKEVYAILEMGEVALERG